MLRRIHELQFHARRMRRSVQEKQKADSAAIEGFPLS
jgi:hypothetical protein